MSWFLDGHEKNYQTAVNSYRTCGVVSDKDESTSDNNRYELALWYGSTPRSARLSAQTVDNTRQRRRISRWLLERFDFVCASEFLLAPQCPMAVPSYIVRPSLYMTVQ